MSNTNSNNDMQRLQQEAMKRAREMQSKARSEQEKNGPQKEEKDKRTETGKDDIEKRMPPPQKPAFYPHEQKSFPMDLIDSIVKDKDRNLILILILILSGEEADSSLILSLLYLLL